MSSFSGRFVKYTKYTKLHRQVTVSHQQRDRVKADLLICFDSKLNSRLSGNEYDDKRGECATLPQKKKRKRQLVAEHKTQQCSSLVTTREKLFQLSSSLIVSHAGRCHYTLPLLLPKTLRCMVVQK